MRFLLYNVRYCTGAGMRFHFPFPGSGYLKRTGRNLDQVTDFIGSLQPDIVGLVEVDGGSFRSGWRNQAEHIARALGHYHFFESKYAERSWVRFLPVANKQVNAFLSSDMVREERFLYFDHGVKRLVIQLELEKMTVFLVHLSIWYRHRQYQLGDLYSLVKNAKKPYLVVGDFNAFWGDPELELFLAATGLQNANVEGLATYPSWSPKRQLDFILYSRGIRVTRFDMPRVTFSDHLPLVCDFEIDEPLAVIGPPGGTAAEGAHMTSVGLSGRHIEGQAEGFTTESRKHGEDLARTHSLPPPEMTLREFSTGREHR